MRLLISVFKDSVSIVFLRCCVRRVCVCFNNLCEFVRISSNGIESAISENSGVILKPKEIHLWSE